MLVGHFDGACEPNPNGTMAWGFILSSLNPKIACRDYGIYWRDGIQATNQVAEYAALGYLLWYIKNNKFIDPNEEIRIEGDSKLVINQMRGEWYMKSGAYIPVAIKIQELANELDPYGNRITYRWIPRNLNTEADELTELALAEVGVRKRNYGN